MAPNKKKKKSKNTLPKKSTFGRPNIIIEDDSDDNAKCTFNLDECVKPNFSEEFDLFAYFFDHLRKTRHIVQIIKHISHLCEEEPKKLFECLSANYSSDPKLVPIQFNARNDAFGISSKITVKFNKLRNRYVEANSDIKRGEVLSIEKAFVFTDKPNTANDRFNVYRCHHCLRVVNYFVTCPYCDVAIFCGYNCRNESWYEYHVWECYGLQRNFWDISSPEYVGMRLLFLGAKHKFDIGDEEFHQRYDKEPDIHASGTFKNPYKYLYRLTYNLKNKSRMDLVHMLMKCAAVLIYLIERTYFFKWFSELQQFKTMKPYEMYIYVGGLLVRHYSQAEIHNVKCDQIIMVSAPFYDRVDFSSAGIFVSESIYSSNCNPNTTFCIRENILVIKATENIKSGQKITVNWHPDQETCSCEHCLKKCQLNAFICLDCKGPIMPLKDADKLKYRSFDYSNVFKDIKTSNGTSLFCKNCENTYDMEIYEHLNNVGQYYISDFKQDRNIRALLKAIEEYKNVFQPTHVFYSYLYIMALEFYINNRYTDNPEELADILTKYLVIVELHFGKYSKSLLSGRCSMILQILDTYYGSTIPSVIIKICKKLLQSIKILGEFHCISYKIHILEGVIRTNYKNVNLCC